MAKQVIQTVGRIDVVALPGGERIENDTGEIDYQVIEASPKSDPSAIYIRRQHMDGRSFLWNAPVVDWNENVTTDDSRWVAE